MGSAFLLPDTVLGSHNLTFKSGNAFHWPYKDYFPACTSVTMLLMAIILSDLLPPTKNWLLNISNITFG